MYKDEVIPCKNCKQEFVWTAGEQEFFERKEVERPEYCMICRSVMKSAKTDEFRGEIGNRKTGE
jgi:hypothetical protein